MTGTPSSRPGRHVFLTGAVAGIVLVLTAVGVWSAVGHHRSGSTGTGSRSASPTALAPASGAGQSLAPSPAPMTGTGGPATGAPATSQLIAGATLPDATPLACPKATVTVSDAAGLTKALAAAAPGAVIRMADGTYVGTFTASTPGTSEDPIWLCGGPGAVLDGGDVKAGYALHLNRASFWRVVGFTVRNAQKGVVLDATSHTVLQSLTVTDVGDEGIHLRAASSFNVVALNTVARTGRLNAKFGEGIYIGSARKNWGKYGAGGGPDRSDFNVLRANHISATTAECVDIKEGTTGGLVEGNSFNGTGGLTAADSWVDVKGNNWHIVGNTGTHSPADGFQTHQIVKGWGTGNVFADNHSVVDGPGYAIHLTNRKGNTVTCTNTATGAGSGTTNVTCSG